MVCRKCGIDGRWGSGAHSTSWFSSLNLWLAILLWVPKSNQGKPDPIKPGALIAPCGVPLCTANPQKQKLFIISPVALPVCGHAYTLLAHRASIILQTGVAGYSHFSLQLQTDVLAARLEVCFVVVGTASAQDFCLTYRPLEQHREILFCSGHRETQSKERKVRCL